jgi:hypothetical protein
MRQLLSLSTGKVGVRRRISPRTDFICDLTGDHFQLSKYSTRSYLAGSLSYDPVRCPFALTAQDRRLAVEYEEVIRLPYLYSIIRLPRTAQCNIRPAVRLGPASRFQLQDH